MIPSSQKKRNPASKHRANIKKKQKKTKKRKKERKKERKN